MEYNVADYYVNAVGVVKLVIVDVTSKYVTLIIPTTDSTYATPNPLRPSFIRISREEMVTQTKYTVSFGGQGGPHKGISECPFVASYKRNVEKGTLIYDWDSAHDNPVEIIREVMGGYAALEPKVRYIVESNLLQEHKLSIIHAGKSDIYTDLMEAYGFGVTTFIYALANIKNTILSAYISNIDGAIAAIKHLEEGGNGVVSRWVIDTLPVREDEYKRSGMDVPDVEDESSTQGVLPDGSAFFIASFPLPEKHWVYEPCVENKPVVSLSPDIDRREFEKPYIEAIRNAIRGATMSGKEMDFDPDALVQNAMVNLFGYYGQARVLHDANDVPKDSE